jgi:hypothetical protein
MTLPFRRGYADEAYAVISLSWLATVNGDQVAPSGVDLDALQADLANIDATNQAPDNFSPVPPPSPS